MENAELETRLMKQLGPWLRQIRLKTDLTPRNVAALVGLDPSEIVAIEPGKDARILNILFLVRITKAIGFVIKLSVKPVKTRATKKSWLAVTVD